MSIKQALDHIPETIRLMIRDYAADLEEAWSNREEDEGLTINFSGKLSTDSQGKNNCDVSISFTKSKIKDKVSFTWDDKQQGLFEGEKCLESRKS